MQIEITIISEPTPHHVQHDPQLEHDMPAISPYLNGTATWSCVIGYGFVRSTQVAGTMTIYRDSFLGGMVEEVSLET